MEYWSFGAWTVIVSCLIFSVSWGIWHKNQFLRKWDKLMFQYYLHVFGLQDLDSACNTVDNIHRLYMSGITYADVCCTLKIRHLDQQASTLLCSFLLQSSVACVAGLSGSYPSRFLAICASNSSSMRSDRPLGRISPPANCQVHYQNPNRSLPGHYQNSASY